ncbi:MAG: GNAT family N-acetyltransferase [Actinomadura sp.]
MSDDVRLRPVAEDDLPVLERFHQDPEAASVFGWFGWRAPGSWRRLWDENRLMTEDAGRLMVVRGPDRLGFVSWHRVQTSLTSFCWSMGIGLLPEARGHGYGTMAQRLLARYLFAHTQVNRVEAATEIDNIAEQRALEKAGFTREGVLRGIAFRNGRWRDGVLYSVVRDDVRLD